MRKIFIDCGGHVGESIELFKSSKEYTEEFEIYSFEPAPNVAKEYKDWKGINFSDKAIWVYDGTITFYLAAITDGNTLFKGKQTGHIDRDNPIDVGCIDFSQWVIKNFSQKDYIILKMDIEGAEFRVIDKMLKDGAMDYIDKLYLEWHFAFDGFPDSVRYNRLLVELADSDVKVYPEMQKVIKER